MKMASEKINSERPNFFKIVKRITRMNRSGPVRFGRLAVSKQLTIRPRIFSASSISFRKLQYSSTPLVPKVLGVAQTATTR
jgi:hypothetical protein